MIIDFSHTVLIEIDVQNDFCPGGALAVDKGDAVVEPLNVLARLFVARGGKVIATQDWHPARHVSFAAAHRGKQPGDTVDLPPVKGQVLWPDHCVQGTAGASFHHLLDTDPLHFIIRKGFRETLDSYSAFFENDRTTPTGLDGLLCGLGINTVVLGGLATDYCVFFSAMDAVRQGYKTVVLTDVVRGVGYPEGSVEKALKQMEEAGVQLASSGEIS
jgi:nicotinamidase/pyrazinamidase